VYENPKKTNSEAQNSHFRATRDSSKSVPFYSIFAHERQKLHKLAPKIGILNQSYLYPYTKLAAPSSRRKR